VSGSDLKQRLAAILAADVAGYSRLMAANERATVAALDAARKVFRSHIESSQGRVVDMAGDSVLAVFETAAGAVSAALGIQEEINLSAEEVPEDRRMRFRIGLHLGDVMEKADGTAYGDGVNIAARLEGLAEPGGITVSESIRTAVRGKISASFENQGEQQVKNIAEPVRVYRVSSEGSTAAKPSSATREFDLSLADKPSIAVLPFADMSKDKDSEYFADGLAEELLNVLSRIPGLRVASRTSAFSFKGRNVDIPTIAQKLNVANILEGSVRTSGKRVRITAQLVRVKTDSHLWSNTYDRDLEDIFAVQDDIARTVARELGATLLPDAARGRSEDFEAYRLYLQGRYFTNRFTREDGARALEYSQRSVELDPRFALGWAGLSRVYTNLANDGSMPLGEAYPKARSAAQRAVELEPALAEGHAALGRVQLFYDWDWKSSSGSFEKALELAPGNADVARHAATLAAALGRTGEALALCRRAVLLDPLSVPAHGDLCTWCTNFSLLDEAESAARTAHELNTQGRLTHYYLGLVHIAQGKALEARSNFDQELLEPLRLFGLAIAHHDLRQGAESDEALSQLADRFGNENACAVAAVHAYRGESSPAFEWLERAYRDRAPGMVTIRSDFLFRKIHNDSRWLVFIERMKFPLLDQEAAGS
jgi:adenylate cyclase